MLAGEVAACEKLEAREPVRRLRPRMETRPPGPAESPPRRTDESFMTGTPPP